MEITKKEIVASITIIAFMLLIGFVIGSKISDSELDKNEKYNKALKIESKDLFEYGMNTNVGNAFVYGDLEAVDTVSYPEIDGEYMYIEKVEEHYNRHTRTVTKTRTNSKGETEHYEEEEVYYSWDYHDSWEKHSEKISFCGVEFDYDKIDTPSSKYLKTDVKMFSDVRFVYYGTGIQFNGTIFTDLRDGTISDNTTFYKDFNIESTVQRLESGGGLIAFWVVWIMLIVGTVCGFYYLDNNWLNK